MSSTETIIIALALTAIIIGHVLISRRQSRNEQARNADWERVVNDANANTQQLQRQLASETGRTKALNKKCRGLEAQVRKQAELQ